MVVERKENVVIMLHRRVLLQAALEKLRENSIFIPKIIIRIGFFHFFSK
jgi:hypothetical protein